MTRVLSLLAIAAVVLGLFWLPQPDAARLGAAHVGSLLTEGTGPDGEEPLLWRFLLDSPAADLEGKTYTLFVRTRGIQRGEEPVLDRIHAEVGASIKRDLRALLAEEDRQLEVVYDPGGERGADLIASLTEPGRLALTVQLPDGLRATVGKAWHPPDGRSLLPPLVAILLAILLRKPVIALFAGVAVGAALVRSIGGAPLTESAGGGILDVFGVYLLQELLDRDRQMIVAFVLFMLAMVGVITRAGGIRGVMDRISRLAASAKSSQVATWLMGLVVFFDDYANTILVGSTMRPLTDRFKVAREKLAYVVDSTAAPVAGISILSTWIAFEVSTFSAQLPDAGLAPDQGYEIFLRTLPFRFYCIFTIFFVGLVTLTGRDFGPMLAAERRARGGKLLRDGAQPMVGEAATRLKAAPHVRPRAVVALLPILTFVAVTLWVIFRDGGGLTVFQEGEGFADFGELLSIEGLTQVLYDGSGFAPMMWGSLAGLVLAALLALAAGLRWDIASAAFASVRSMAVGLAILYLAWSIGRLCLDLDTAEYLSALVGDAINPILLPVALFLLAGFVAFATGSSWGTMTILLPLVVGLAYTMGNTLEGFGGEAMLVVSIGAVLEGAIFGDHCSPISDTTVMSSIASASDHIDHVRTQMPYAVTTMAVAMVAGYVPAVLFGLSPWVSLLAGCALLVLLLLWKGRRAEEPATP